MKKRINAIITILAFIFLGLYVSKWSIINEIKLFLYILVSFVVCIILQEISFILIGQIYGIVSHVICIGPFAIFKRNGKLKVKFKMRAYSGFLGNIQGVHIPDIKSKEEFERVKKNLKIVLCAGFFADIIIVIVALILIFTAAFKNHDFKMFLIISIIMAELLGFISVFGGSVKSALNMKKSSEEEVLQDLLLLGIFYEGTKEAHRFSYLIERYLVLGENIKVRNYSDDEMLKNISYVSELIYMRLGGIVNKVPSNIMKFIQNIIKKKEQFVGKPRFSRRVLNLVYRYILYLAVVDNNNKDALELYNYFAKFLYYNDKRKNYTKVFIEHILGIEDNYEYLMDANNLIKSKGGMWFGYGIHEVDVHMINLKNS
ncbi:hypothetical protein BJV85_003599 [Clostridium acetobutylicum]|uniref:Predicted membrane protein n=1 Tax=Clostridium acetobutylicum (strain ATCC 824 / DSM 792 / JCM 1419 / IAM 19013 / LMG 5710 / NBRC 13948 / NRRL B-527 / VKM B-1787 / 2291 / W) TaxID=272562 RepID=Q97LY1_CLOAB|nr:MULTISPECIES: hypothetical protein [Clostridium]AAK78399.1 Predicted membrane protein [Clostridium acetobutylicum ATCC 824]ADZ19468.1 membrane protein [Clostridium acetobutylicum EA 2018]AEI31233.1 hypothetical protein SMB_G0427 [Clostridium acetobutylicum DSM 1731]AWV80122.1 hypothetical protein DK921_08450 [Clostridium acetobutylicum]MBC2392301.1 hypothetical protein [Clostridium acetobutylicum]